jgi:hypothetical protein
MNTLFTFGCSYTDNFVKTKHENYDKYFQFRGGNYPLTWNEILSQKLNLILKNYGQGGCGNDYIFQTFCKHLDEYKQDDIIIVEWSYNERFKWADDNLNRWVHLSSGSEMKPELSLKTSQEIAINRESSIYINDLLNYEKIINTLSKYIGFKVFYWCADYKISINLQSNIHNNSNYLCNEYIKEGETIFSEIFRRNGQRIQEETNGLIEDLHMGESGHKIQSELFYEYILKYYHAS